MRTRILIPFIFFNLVLFGQIKKFDCKKIIDKEPYFVRNSASGDNDSLRFDLEIFKECGKLDSIDMELLNGPLLGTILLKHQPKSKVLTYKAILSSIDQFKKSKDYPGFRDLMIVSKTLENKVADPKEFEKDKKLFLKFDMTEQDLEAFKAFLIKNDSSKWTYKEAFTIFSASKKVEQNQAPEVKLKFNELIDLENAMALAKSAQKNIIVYFTCYACVGSIKMDERILTDPKVKSLIIDNYVYFAAYADDNRPAENNTTIGKKYKKIQSEKFHSEFQPHFFILDKQGNIISDQGYTAKTEEFILFLNKGLKN